MSQLPPKIPSLPHNWPDFSCQTLTSMENPSPSWVDEFLDFSSVRRGSHRRSSSDSIAFLEAAPMVEECRRSSLPNGNCTTNIGIGSGDDQFERFDDEQLMSMFTDAMDPGAMSGSNPSSPSDHNSINGADHHKFGPSEHLQQLRLEPKSEPDQEVQSSCSPSDGAGAGAVQNAVHAALDNSNEKIFDPKRIKRILANRQSAQRSRVRKLQYISELERSVTALQAEVSVLSPRVAFLDHQRLVLNVDNSVLKQRIAALAQDKAFKDAHQEALKREIERLRLIYCEQKSDGAKPVSTPTTSSSSADANCAAASNEQLVI